MDFLALATQTLSVDPPAGTGHHHKHHHDKLPVPTGSMPIQKDHYILASDAGHTALWIVFVIFTVGLLGVGVLALRVEKRARLFHWLSAAVLTFAMVSYLAMATGMGITFTSIPYHDQENSYYHVYREVYWARYVDWLFTTPLLLVSLAFLAGLSPADTVLAIAADVFMIVTGLISTTIPSRYADGERAKWLFYGLSCLGFVLIFVILINGGMQAASLRQSKTRGLFYLLTAMTLVLWTAYPIVFALTEGTNQMTVNTEIIAYAILDVAAKVGFTYLLLSVHSHGEDDTYTLPDWFVEPREKSGQIALAD